jgi:hypothetical protein
MVELQAEASVADRNPLMALVAQVKLLAAGRHLSQAQKLLRLLESEYPVAEVDRDTFFRLFPAAILACDPDLALSWLRLRYKPSHQIAIEPAGPGLAVDVAIMRVHGDELRFQLSPALFEFHAGDMILSRWAAMFPLWDAFMTSSSRIDGTVAVNLLDNGSSPGLTFCDCRPGYYLMPDSTFMSYDQYDPYRIEFRANEVAWSDRAPIAYWRGSASGLPADAAVGWRSLPRIRLCEIGAENPEIIDAGITNISQAHTTDPAARTELEARNLLRPRVPALNYKRYRYQIDIDGYSNAWDGFFLRLLTGSPVLKVASRLGFEQWYYDRLKPWVNFIPIDAEMTDLVDKVTWLRTNDDVARKIGEAGRQLAESLDQREIARTVPVIAAAIRAEAGGPLIDLRFGAATPDNGALRSGWRAPDGDGVIASGFESRLMLPKPPGFGDYILMAELSPAIGRSPCQITIAANGEPILNRSIAERMTVYCPLPRSIAIAGEAVDLSFHFPANAINVADAGSGDNNAPGMTLHRVGVAAADPNAWAGYPDAGLLLEDLNAGWPPSVVHDLGWQSLERAQLALPPGATPRTLRTFFGTILYVDREAGRVRHAPAPRVPRNLVLVRLGDTALLARAGDDGTYVAVRLRPEGPRASRDNWTPWAAGGLARTFAIVAVGGDTHQIFGLRAAGLFVCAEANGEVTLNRTEAGEWEQFSVEPDDA